MRFIKLVLCILFIISFVFSVYIYFSDNSDYEAPEIKCDTDTITVSVNDPDEKILSHVSAYDKKDGDVTESIIIESISPFISKKTAKVTFAVCDSENNVRKLEKDIVFSDYTSPEFKINRQHVYYIGATKADLVSGVGAFDCLDGDISSRVNVADSQLDFSQPGVYPITYSVTSSKGITSEININAYVYASRLSESILLKSYLVYTDMNNPVNPQSFIESYPEEYFENNYYSNYDYSFDIIDDVDYTKPGVYYITYRLTRTSNNSYFDDKTEILAEAYLAVAVRGDSK